MTIDLEKQTLADMQRLCAEQTAALAAVSADRDHLVDSLEECHAKLDTVTKERDEAQAKCAEKEHALSTSFGKEQKGAVS